MTAVYIILVVIFWGVWGIFGKLATRHNDELAVVAISYLSYPIMSLVLFIIVKMKHVKIDWGFTPLTYIFLAALSAMLGSAFYYIALTRGNTSIVVSLCALYPAVTLFVALFVFNEKLSIQQIIGIVVILIGIFLISYTPAKSITA